jgi:S1-C subfamily serine protease
MPDGKVKTAKVIVRSTEHDFAILKMDGENFPFLNFGKLDEIREGEGQLPNARGLMNAFAPDINL